MRNLDERIYRADFFTSQAPAFVPIPEPTAEVFTGSDSPMNLDYILDHAIQQAADIPYVGQGGCITDDNIAISFRVLNTSEGERFTEGVAIAYDLENYVELWRSPIHAGHANDGCYYNGRVYIAAHDYIISYEIGRTGLTRETRLALDIEGIRGISYDRITGEFYTASENRIYRIDMSTGHCIEECTYREPYITANGVLRQGIEVVNGIAYLAYSYPNHILQIDLRNGEVLRAYSIPANYHGHVIGELETLSFNYNSNSFLLFSYGRAFDLPTYDFGNLAPVHLWYWGSTVITNDPITYFSNDGTSTGHSQATERNINVNEETCLRHTGDERYPFSRLPDALYYAAFVENLGRPWTTIKVYTDQSQFSSYLHIVKNTKMFLYNGARINKIYVENGNSFEIRAEQSGTHVNEVKTAGNSNLYVYGDTDRVEVSRNTQLFIDEVGTCQLIAKDALVRIGIYNTDDLEIDSHGTLILKGDGLLEFSNYGDDGMGHLHIKGADEITLPDDLTISSGE